MTRRRTWGAIALLWLACAATDGRAQPTYKNDVRPNLKPHATLRLAGNKLSHGGVKDDPGFRLQYHFKKNAASVTTVEGRSNPSLDVPTLEAGVYTVVLELFYPAYKGGAQQKGEFKTISNVVTYRVEAAGKPGEPVKATLLDAGLPTLVIHCGKGAQQDEVVGSGHGSKLLQGTPFDGWPAGAGASHAWIDPKAVRFEVTLPPGSAGTLRLLFVDGDNLKRKQKLTVQGKAISDVDAFGGAGKIVDVPVSKDDSKSGKIEVTVQNLNPTGSAAISSVVFTPAPVK